VEPLTLPEGKKASQIIPRAREQGEGGKGRGWCRNIRKGEGLVQKLMHPSPEQGKTGACDRFLEVGEKGGNENSISVLAGVTNSFYRRGRYPGFPDVAGRGGGMFSGHLFGTNV